MIVVNSTDLENWKNGNLKLNSCYEYSEIFQCDPSIFELQQAGSIIDNLINFRCFSECDAPDSLKAIVILCAYEIAQIQNNTDGEFKYYNLNIINLPYAKMLINEWIINNGKNSCLCC